MNTEKPPVGLMPERVWITKRVQALLGAISRYVEADKIDSSVTMWVEELSRLTTTLQTSVLSKETAEKCSPIILSGKCVMSQHKIKFTNGKTLKILVAEVGGGNTLLLNVSQFGKLLHIKYKKMKELIKENSTSSDKVILGSLNGEAIFANYDLLKRVAGQFLKDSTQDALLLYISKSIEDLKNGEIWEQAK